MRRIASVCAAIAALIVVVSSAGADEPQVGAVYRTAIKNLDHLDPKVPHANTLRGTIHCGGNLQTAMRPAEE